MTPMPPAWAMAIAIRPSVTVSMAAESSGMLQAHLAGEPRAGVGGRGQHLGGAGHEEHVVEREGFAKVHRRDSDPGDRGVLFHASRRKERGRVGRPAARRRGASSPAPPSPAGAARAPRAAARDPGLGTRPLPRQGARGARRVSLPVFRPLPENDCSPGFKAV